MVDTDASEQLAVGASVSASERFDPAEDVHHLIYFVQPTTHMRLTEWLL